MMNQTPSCFGKLWDAGEPECAGGYDPSFVGANGSKSRPRCDFFESCKIRKVMSNANDQQRVAQSLIPPQTLVRPPQGPYTQPYQGRTAAPPQPQQPYYPYPQVQVPPMQMMSTNFSMPAYLTAPESRQEDESFWAPLGREIVRGMGKAFGHSLAHFFDVTIMRSRKDEPPR